MYRNGVAIERRIWGPFGPQTALTEVFYMSARTVKNENSCLQIALDKFPFLICVISSSNFEGKFREILKDNYSTLNIVNIKLGKSWNRPRWESSHLTSQLLLSKNSYNYS